MAESLTTHKYTELYEQFNQWLLEGDEELRFSTVLGRICNYTLRAPGKRIRPVLAMAAAEMLGIEQKSVKPFSLAVEYIHTFSLIHDDLPALDNDELRRGQATAHVEFGEAAAILAGDALQARAFEIIADCNAEPTVIVEWTKLLSQTVVSLCDGQVLDTIAAASPMVAEAGQGTNGSKAAFAGELDKRHLLKTAALIKASLIGPTFLLPKNEAERVRSSLAAYGESLGLLFQITDDILDGEEYRGFSVDGSAVQEVTYFNLYGVEESRRIALALCERAKAALEPFGERAELLCGLCDYVLNRSS